MIALFSEEEKWSYELKELLHAFTSTLLESQDQDCQKWRITLEKGTAAQGNFIRGRITEGESVLQEKREIFQDPAEKLAYKRCLYDLLKEAFHKELPWGILTGIRPVKLVHALAEKGHPWEAIPEYLERHYKITPAKIHLMMEIAKVQQIFMTEKYKKGMSLYLSIPFCPSRCHYCSFFSNDLEKAGHLRDAYLSALEVEMKESAKAAANMHRPLQTVYIGGGTPGTLTENQIDRLFQMMHRYFDCGSVEEWTFEAGRPDCITREQLGLLKRWGVHRISINPQTMSDTTLKKIGRNHTVAQIESAYQLARDMGFENINMDFILGLGDETEKEVQASMEKMKPLNPDSLTIHALALKRGSFLKEQGGIEALKVQKDMEEQLKASGQAARDLHMKPYYLYRQKNIVGNLENTGYCKEGKESLYNILMMEEVHPILAFGAGAASKFLFSGNRIERCINVKNLDDYLRRSQEMASRKIGYMEESIQKEKCDDGQGEDGWSG